MERKVESAIKCINQADNLLSIFRKKYIEFQEDKKDMSLEEINDNERLLGSQFGLICEYYLKGLLLPCIEFDIPTDAPELQVVIDNLTPEQEYKLLIGDKDIKSELSRIYNIAPKKINKLIEQSIKKIGGNGHDLSYFIGTQFLQENRKIKLPLDVRKEIYKGMESYFSDKLTPKSHEEWKKFLIDFYVIDDVSSERTNTHEVEFETTIADSSISDAFFSGRYGHLENYIPNLEALYHLAYSIRDSIKKQYPNAISITDGIFDGYNNSRGVRYIFPDENSKIYVFDDKNKLTRVYTLEKADDFLSRQYGFSLNSGKHEYSRELKICPEYGVERIKEMSEYTTEKDGLADVSMYPTSLLRVEKDRESMIICQIDGKQKGYIYRNGRIIDTNEERIQEYNQLMNRYETERKDGLYDDETQKIRANFFDKKRSEKNNAKYEEYLENRLGVKEQERRMRKLMKYATLSLQGAYVFKGTIIGKKLLDKSSNLLETVENEENAYQEFFDEEIKKIEDDDVEAQKKAEENIVNIKNDLLIYSREQFAAKRATHENLENQLNEEELIEAYEDKHGIGKELLSKIKKVFMSKGEK